MITRVPGTVNSRKYRTRFAPSPTGPLHLGHAYSALLAWDRSQAAGGVFVLRIEDIDAARARPEWEAAIFRDLRWLGLQWCEPVMRQSTRHAAYRAALKQLWDRGLVYPCTCSRRDIAEALSAPQEGTPRLGPDGPIYPGTCRGRSRVGSLPQDAVLRLDMRAAVARLDRDLSFEESGDQHGPATITDAPVNLVEEVGDFVLARRDMGTSYHLSVVIDDAAQDITEVVRGADLFDATRIHVLLQALLSLPTPIYYHHKLIRDEIGKRLAKRDDARALSLLRDEGASPAEIRTRVGL